MRWLAVFTITLLLAGVRCLSACTLSSWAPQTPPCHQHHKAPAQASNPCDQQDAVSASTSLATTHLALIQIDVVTPSPMLTAPLLQAASLVVESPPGLATFSVLRI